MSNIRKIAIVFGAFFVSACSMDHIVLEGGIQDEDQIQQTITAIPDRANADIYGIYSIIGQQFVVLGGGFHNDFGYPAQCLSQDLNGADMVCDNSSFNWFSDSSAYTDRNTGYAVAMFRYANPYNLIKLCNDVIVTINPATATKEMLHTLGQAKVMRALGYYSIAPYYQFSYITNPDDECVPLVTEKTLDYANNPRATNRQIYGLMIEDLTEAIEYLKDYSRGTSKVEADQQVAYGLRARVNLAMGNYEEAASDAAAAREGYTPASIEQVSTPAFCKITEPNWIWGIQIENTNIGTPLATWPSKLSSFTGQGYTGLTGCYKRINKLLYDKIDSKDVRKGWWINEELDSPLLNTVTWEGKTGKAISSLKIPNSKEAFVPYTNVKFGMKSGIGSIQNDSDWPLMRVEEMILVEIEGLAKSGKEPEAARMLEEFISTYRYPAYKCSKTGQELYDEIWKQRRIELWGEGFAMYDVMRLQKNIVRITGTDTANWPDDFAFNVEYGDPYLLLRFPDSETNVNLAVPPTENTGGDLPETLQNANLKDGVIAF